MEHTPTDGSVWAAMAASRRRALPTTAGSSRTRGKLLQMILDEPDVTIRDAANQLKTGIQNIRYHVRMLEAAGLVKVGRQGRRVHLTPIQDAVGLTDDQRAAATNPLNYAILEAVVHRGDVTRQAISQSVGVSTQRVQRRVVVLVRVGLVSVQRDGRCIYHSATPAGRQALRALADR